MSDECDICGGYGFLWDNAVMREYPCPLCKLDIVPCPQCDGAGGWHEDNYDGTYIWVTCRECGGGGA